MAAVEPCPTMRAPVERACSRAPARLGVESVWLQFLTVYMLLLLLQLPALVAPDSWLAFVAGREVAHYGLPTTDRLTVWTTGAPWVDQQWLGQLLLYGVAALGGLRLALLAHVALLVGAFGIVLTAARRLGASPSSTAVGGALVLLAAAPSTALRTETLAYPLFAVLVYLLLADVRVPSHRVLLALPLLALWANVHGSVMLGAGLASLRGFDRLASRRSERPAAATSLALIVGAPLAVFASPYGPSSLFAYYRRTIGNRAFPHLLTEWTPSSPSHEWRLYVLAAVVAVGVAAVLRAGHRVTRFELAALLVLFAAAVDANRNIVWFALFSGFVVPRLLELAWRRPSVPPPVRLNRAVWAALAGAVGIVGIAQFGRSPDWYARDYPTGATTELRNVALAEPGARVLATDRLGDWLLWTIPQFRGRVAYDTRFELLGPTDIASLIRLVDLRPGWPRVISGYRLVLLERVKYARVERGLLRRGATLVYADARVVVLRIAEPAQQRGGTHPFGDGASSGPRLR